MTADQKPAFLFPGQGSQFPGMGEDLAREYREAEAVFDRAAEVLDFDLKDLCFSGPAEELKKTVNTQPAILTASVATWRVLEAHGIRPVVAGGHSLGEYSALVAAGVLTFADALQLVRKRGRYMQESVALGEGGMAAVLGLGPAEVKEVCSRVETGFVRPANYNCPGQVVISGDTRGLEEAKRLFEGAGARRVITLPVSAPFHCSLLEDAADKLRMEIEHVRFRSAEFPVVSNYDATLRRDPEEIRKALIRQVASPVLWEESVRRMLDLGCEFFLEVGPGNVLKGFMNRIECGVEAMTVGDLRGMNEFLEEHETAEGVKNAAR